MVMNEFVLTVGIPSSRDLQESVSIIRSMHIPDICKFYVVIARWSHNKLTPVELDILSSLNVTVSIVYSEMKYPPNLRNSIIEHINTGHVLFLDDDVEVEPDIIYELIKCIKKCNKTVFQAPPYLTANVANWLARMEGEAYKKGFLSYVNGQSVALLDARTLLAPINVMKSFKFDDELIFGGEGRDLATRLLLNGINLEIADNIVSRHHNRETFKALYMQKITHGRGRGQDIKSNKIGVYNRVKYYCYYLDRHFVSLVSNYLRGKTTFEETIYSLIVNSFFWIGVFDQLLFNNKER